ncbi:MAG TPA: amino acid adenylation domain-containing protein [Stellaceae bacterium]|nr:amino acid adenylation domain-containing protein [Stellaceae bacterium]
MSDTAPLSEAKRLLLQKMLAGGNAPRRESVPSITPRAPGTAAPISAEQMNVWIHAAMAQDVPLYNEAVTIHRRGSLDIALLERSFDELLRRHESWRSSFALVEGEVMQIVAPECHIKLALTDLSALSPEEREAAAQRLAIADARKPFDLAQAPLWRGHVVCMAAGEYRIYLALHHIIFDGVSLYQVMVPELAAIYAAYEAGATPSLPAPRLQYGDYALWRKQRLASGAFDTQLAYWRERLSGELPVLQLPSDRPRPDTLAYRGAMENFALSGALTQRLKALAKAEGVTLYMVLLAAYKVMLHRYSGQDDVIVGGVTDTRRRPELQALMGYFLNSVALRSRPQADKPFRAFLKEVRDTVLGALDHSDAPFDHVVRAVKPKRDASRHPLFQVLFSIQPPMPAFGGGWDLTQMDVAIGTAKLDLYLELEERAEGLIGRFLYSTELFDIETIRAMIGHWTTLLEGIVADPSTTLARLPLLTHAESQQILRDWNATQRDIPHSTLPHWFETTARANPDATAIVSGDESWTYQTLDQRANVLAARLSLAGIGPGALVAVALERGPDMVAGLLAIAKAGAAYLPLDPALPAQRFAFIIADAQPVALLTQRDLKALLPPVGVPVILCDENSTTGEAPAHEPLATPDSLAYVLYTSGSTGKPKGVKIPQRALVNLLASMQERPGFAPGQSLLSVTTLSFDIAALELYLPLVSGGTVIIADRETVSDPPLLAALIAGARPDMMQATPATWRGLIESGWRGAKDTTILCGGEALSRDLADQLLPRCAALWNMYGPTETTIWSTVERVTAGRERIAIGRPIANTSVYILDANGNPVPAGVTGEIHIGGAGLAEGYHRRDVLTRERFVERDLGDAHERLYRTGDLGRFRRDGTIECLGRTDHQVKIRGFRVAIEEVEGALAAHPRLIAAAARAWPDSSGEHSLAGYFVSYAEPVPSAAELRRFLRQSLPDYMIPSRFVALAELPMTPNRKIDRNALPEPESNVVAIAPAAPQTEHEAKLADIWKDVLGLTTIGRNDNFHDLGGHSLLMAKLVTRIEKQFERRLSMASIFQAPTLKAMAALLSEPLAPPISRLVPIQPNGTRPPLYWLFGGATVRPLAHALGDDQPFFGVALDHAEEQRLAKATSLAEFAAPLIKAIRDAQPTGPYYIGGWCTAGILAYEVARQLTEDGAEIGLLVMVHSTNPVHYRRITPGKMRASKIRHHLKTLLRLDGAARWRYAVDRFRGVMEGLRDRVRPPHAVENVLWIGNVLDHAALHYETPLYAGDVALFQPADRPDVLDYRQGWRDVVRGAFATFEIPGGHRTMLEEPYVAELGARMNACLRRAQMQTKRAAPQRRAAG